MLIKATYLINKETYALIPARSLDYDTIVLEKHHIHRIQQTPMQIIEQSCRERWSTYEDRRQAVSHHLDFHQKVPIPISFLKHICLFPTHSPTHIDNHWLAYQNIETVQHIKDVEAIFNFQDGQSLKINVSKHTIQTQMKRTHQIIKQLGQMKKIPTPYKKGPIGRLHIHHIPRQ